jgi:hypothetical protein
MWPEYAAGRNQLAEARLDYASYALSTHAYRLAHTQAFAAAAHARQSDRWDLFRKAEDLAGQAERAASLETARQHHLRRLRIVLSLAAVLIIAGLVVGFAVVRGDRRSLAQALSSARAAEAGAELARTEAEASVRELKGWAPEWLSRARGAFADARYPEAAQDAEATLRLDPQRSEAWRVMAAALALSGDRERARAAAESFANARGQDDGARSLREAVDRVIDAADAAPEDVETLRALALAQ